MTEIPCPGCQSPLAPELLSPPPTADVQCGNCGTAISPESIAVESFRRSVSGLQRTVDKLAKATEDLG